MVCCDTNFLIGLMRKESSALNKLQSLKNDGETLTTTIINVAELYYGACRYNDVRQEISKVESILQFFDVLNLDKKSCEINGMLSYYLRSTPIEDSDALIASICLSNNQKLITNDNHFTRVTQLPIESW